MNARVIDALKIRQEAKDHYAQYLASLQSLAECIAEFSDSEADLYYECRDERHEVIESAVDDILVRLD